MNSQTHRFFYHYSSSASLRAIGNFPSRPSPSRQAAQSCPVPAGLPANPVQASVLRPGPQPRGLPTAGRQGGAEGQGRPHRLHQGHLRLRQLNRGFAGPRTRELEGVRARSGLAPLIPSLSVRHVLLKSVVRVLRSVT